MTRDQPLGLCNGEAELMFKVFISHSTQYLRNVPVLHQSLSGTGVTAFVAKDAIPLLAKDITSEIESCDLFLLLWSCEAESSPRVAQEVESARSFNKKILPLVRSESSTFLRVAGDMKYTSLLVDPALALAQAREMMLESLSSKFPNSHREQDAESSILLGLGAVLLWVLGQE